MSHGFRHGAATDIRQCPALRRRAAARAAPGGRRNQWVSAATPKNSFTSRSAEAGLSEACTEFEPLDFA